MRTTTRLALATTVLFGAACGGVPLTAGADLDPGYDFTQFTSYTWDEPDDQPTGDPRLDNNPFFVHRLHSAIHWELATRGIEYNAEGPALAVHHHAVVRDRVDVYEADRTAGYSTEYGEGTQVIQYEEATFLVDIADARTKEILWRGWAKLDLGTALENPEVMRDQIDVAIDKMFENFPIPYGGVPQVEQYEGR
jgi:hypothetical protein